MLNLYTDMPSELLNPVLDGRIWILWFNIQKWRKFLISRRIAVSELTTSAIYDLIRMYKFSAWKKFKTFPHSINIAMRKFHYWLYRKSIFWQTLYLLKYLWLKSSLMINAFIVILYSLLNFLFTGRDRSVASDASFGQLIFSCWFTDYYIARNYWSSVASYSWRRREIWSTWTSLFHIFV